MPVAYYYSLLTHVTLHAGGFSQIVIYISFDKLVVPGEILKHFLVLPFSRLLSVCELEKQFSQYNTFEP